MYQLDTSDFSGLDLLDSSSGQTILASVTTASGAAANVRGAPRLTASTPSDNLAGVNPTAAVITLQFNETVKRGSGDVVITDGVVQTVIDRATGLPTMRIVGATDTRTIAIDDTSQVTVVGGVVTVKAGTLLNNTKYSVLVDKGALVDVDGNAFAGISDSARLDFTTSAASQAPSATISLDQTTVGMGGTIGVTVTFSEAVQPITASNFIVANGTLGSFTSNADKTVWSATFTPSSTTIDATNAITLPAANFRDLGGMTGAAAAVSVNYVVDTVAPVAMTALAELPDVAADLVLTFSEAVYWDDASEILLTFDDAIMHIARDEVTFSDDHTTLTIPASAHQMAADKIYTLTLPASVVDSAANQVLNRVIAVDTYNSARVSSIAIIDNGDSASDDVTGVTEQTISGGYNGTLEDGETIRLVIDGELVPEGSVEVNTAERTWYYNGWVGSGEHSVVAYIDDGSGVPRGWKSLAFEVDTSAPQPADGYEFGGIDPTADLLLEFDENIYWTDSSKLVISDGTTIRQLGVDDVTIAGNYLSIDAAKHGMVLDETYTIGLPSGLQDQFGNGGWEGTIYLYTSPDDVAPEALAGYVTTANGVKKAGDLVTIVVRFSEPVKVDSWAELQVGPEQWASYDHHVGTDVTFHYEVQEGDAFDNLALFDHTGLLGAVRDLAGNALDLSGIKFNVLTRPDGSTVNIDVDGAAPDEVSAPVLALGSDTGPSSDDNITGDKTPTFTGTGADPWATVRLLRNGEIITSSAANAAGEWSIDAPTQGSGTYVYTVVQEDTAGNMSAESEGLVVTIDAHGPSKVGNTVADNVLSLIFDEKFTFDSGAIYIYSGSTLVETVTKHDTEFWSIDPDGKTLSLQPLLDSGSYTVKFAEDTLLDLFGNPLTELVGSVPGVAWTIYHV